MIRELMAVAAAARAFRMTAVVNDDFPEMMHNLDVAIMNYEKVYAPYASKDLQMFGLIEDELIKARKKFPVWKTESVHAAAVVCEEAGELIRAALQHSDEGGLITACDKEAIQTGAMAIRFLTRE